MIVHANAATRIDLAGGTLDIFPLYLLEEYGITVNVAIDLASSVRLATREDGRIVLLAEDLNLIEQAASLDDLPLSGPMGLVARVTRFYAPRTGVEIATRNQAPPGSGLGASSSLLIALSAALTRLTRKRILPEKVIDYGSSIETQAIRIPAGKQDYYPAMYGGFHALWFETAGARRERLRLSKKFRDALQGRLLLCFTGESRFSGTSNWSMLKRYIDRSGDTVQRMKRIKEIALGMREALLGERLDQMGRLLQREWENRRELAAGVSNARIDSIMAAARSAGALASKICGAGGGGCMITFVKAGRRPAVARALSEAGAHVLNYRFREAGVRVEVEAGQ
ncbi:MAG: GHMP kinase [Acidobacteria bacterium]|nr:GHMP kinase [Acidobacteriota bacterium]